MSHKLQIRALFGLVVVITILVGVLVWPTPKNALADTVYYVHIFYGSSTGIEDLSVRIWFSDGDVHRAGGPANDLGNGWYSRSWNGAPAEVDNWEVEVDNDDIENGNWILVDPSENPITDLSLASSLLEWEWIAEVRRDN